MSEKVRHVCGISGGKDSAALAIYLKETRKLENVEYFFSDTGAELPEVYAFLDRLEAFLGQEIERLNSGKDFAHYLKMYGNFLPSPRQRWCTREMKIKPFEDWLGQDSAISYIAIRADEDRDGYVSTKPTITPAFPFKEDGITRADVFRILEESVGVPEYYKWRSRSGCYFCFFQRRSEWLGLKNVHPDLFEKAKDFEKTDAGIGKSYTWVQGMSLSDLEAKADAIRSKASVQAKGPASWQRIVDEEDDGDLEDGCLICHL
jgi:hypothetical protein